MTTDQLLDWIMVGILIYLGMWMLILFSLAAPRIMKSRVHRLKTQDEEQDTHS